MDLELIILSAVRKREKQISYHSYVESKKVIEMNYLQNRNRLTDIENKLTTTKGERWWSRGINQDFGSNRFILLYIK